MMKSLPKDLSYRNAHPDDHHRIIGVLKDWWDGRDLTGMLPKLFLVHFCNTSFIIEKNGDLVAFLIGFLSPQHTNEGYIHFCGVHPDYRSIGLGKFLYHKFFTLCKNNNRYIVKSCTSPVNKGSIAFHKKTGFQIEPGESKMEGVPITLHYNKPNDPKVLFKINL